MLASILNNVMSVSQLEMLGTFAGFLVTFLLLAKKFSFLPHDQGREFAINGELSRGKLRGVGLIIVCGFIVVSLILGKLSLENLIFTVLLFLIMLSGYLDDASKNPWSDYKKGAIDLAISIAYMVTFVIYNPTDVQIFSLTITLPKVVYVILGIILIWVSINVVNCSDGIDGLCATLTIMSVGSYIVFFGDNLMEYRGFSMILLGCIFAYLYFNTLPSSMLMGDAGSRAFGFFLAVIAMKSGHPFSFLVFALVMIIDGGLGLCKVFLLRFLKIHILTNTRTPIHDHMRKNIGWKDQHVVTRFALFQVIASCALGIFLK
ncbi:MAG: phospho-N-acetylmuramoyl-pentapeptide-transferase [Dorea sp.]|nr:phospho-N-acetylmuramoyl-pentapeptide-transferase [Dorea sp.]